MMDFNQEKYQKHFNAVNRSAMNIKFVPIKYQTEEICLAAVRQNGVAINHIRHQTPEICLAAVKNTPHALKYVNNQTPEMCLAAVLQNAWALGIVKEQTPEICLLSVKSDGRTIQYVENQTPEICLAAIMNYPMAIRYVEEIESIALLVDEDHIDKHLNLHEKYKKIKEINQRMKMSDSALERIDLKSQPSRKPKSSL